MDLVLETRIKALLPEYSSKKIKNVVIILRSMLEKPYISANEIKDELGVTNRIVERYIADLKSRDIMNSIYIPI